MLHLHQFWSPKANDRRLWFGLIVFHSLLISFFQIACLHLHYNEHCALLPCLWCTVAWTLNYGSTFSQCFQSDVCRSSSQVKSNANNHVVTEAKPRLRSTHCRASCFSLWENSNNWRWLNESVSTFFLNLWSSHPDCGGLEKEARTDNNNISGSFVIVSCYFTTTTSSTNCKLEQPLCGLGSKKCL